MKKQLLKKHSEIDTSSLKTRKVVKGASWQGALDVFRGIYAMFTMPV